MTIATYNKQFEITVNDMQKYIDSFKMMEHKQAKRAAKKSLVESGVMRKDGTLKRKFCK